MRNWLGAGDSRSWADALLGVCCTRCWLMIMAWRDREGWLNFVFLGDGRVEHKKERDQRRWGKSSRETGTWRISCASQLTIPDTAGTSPNPAGINTDTRSSNPIRQVVLLISHSRSYPPYRSHLHPPSLSFSCTTLPSSQEHKVKSFLSISPCHNRELTPSTAYTKSSISQRSTVSHSQPDFELTPECSFSFRRTSLPIDRHQPVLHTSYNCQATLSHSHGYEVTNRSIESRRAVHRPPPSTHQISLDHGLQVYLHTRSITASKCISKLARSRPPSASPNSLDHGPQVYLQTRSITACKFARSWPPSAYLHTRSITASKCISKLARLPPPSASPKSLDHGLGVYLWVHLIVIFRRTLNSCQAPPAASPDIACVDG